MAKRGGFNGGGMGNMNQLMKQAQKLQKQMEETSDEIDAMTFAAASGGGAVEAVVSGANELVSVTISPDAVDPEDVEMLQDLIVAAVNEALRKSTEHRQSAMARFTGGMGGLGGGLF